MEPETPIVDVAIQCGFASQSQFTTKFRRFTGVTPGKFRQGRTLRSQTVPLCRVKIRQIKILEFEQDWCAICPGQGI